MTRIFLAMIWLHFYEGQKYIYKELNLKKQYHGGTGSDALEYDIDSDTNQIPELEIV